MMKITCIYVLAMIARTFAASGEVTCCPPGQYLSIAMVEGNATCYTLESNITAPSASLYCEFGYFAFQYESFLFEDGKVHVREVNGSSHNDVTNIYCVNDMYSPTMNISMKFGLVCLDPPEVQVNAYLMIVSVIFLILTVIIYSSLSELRDLQGISFINFCGSLAIGSSIFIDISLKLDNYGDMHQCAARGFFAYFFLMVSFFWTTAISIHFLLNIRSPSAARRDWKIFAWYALFAWGFPAVLTICMAIYNFHPGDHAKPGIGIRSCWFDEIEKPQQWYWMHSVLAVLVTINVSIFVYVSSIFCRKEFGSSHKTMLKYKFGLTVKLFIVMGLYWIIELLAQFDHKRIIAWKILIGVIVLKGVWIFLAWVVFRKRVIRAMQRRGWLLCISGWVEKHLENDDEADDDIIEHTSVPMNEH